MWLFDVIASVALVVAAAAAFWYLRNEKRRIEQLAQEARNESERTLQEANKQAETLKREALLEAKDEALRLKAEAENEIRERRAELQRLERRLAQKEEALDRKAEQLERRERAVQKSEAGVQDAYRDAAELVKQRRVELQRVAQMTVAEARALLLEEVRQETRQDAARVIREVEEEARRVADERARHVIALAIQRCAVEHTSETTVSVVPLPSDEMKGRIIGREGRNIRTFETLTGVDVVIDDTPEAVVLSSFDPVRREVARLALTELVLDGRIHPSRIEEAVEHAQLRVNQSIRDAGEQAVLETGVTGLAPELVRLLGQLKYRTSFGQNVLRHSIEVSHLSALLAAELGANERLARRAGLLHDIGKAVDHEVEGSHAAIGAALLREHGEKPDVVRAVELHHEEGSPDMLEAVILMCADAISASRPGARRETLETYVRRVRKLEEIAQRFPGVEKGFAVQAGREVRLIVKPDQIDDLAMAMLARDLARRIEEEMEYPGQIKVTVIRETRAVEYAK